MLQRTAKVRPLIPTTSYKSIDEFLLELSSKKDPVFILH